jgi:hypothetical protein
LNSKKLVSNKVGKNLEDTINKIRRSNYDNLRDDETQQVTELFFCRIDDVEDTSTQISGWAKLFQVEEEEKETIRV